MTERRYKSKEIEEGDRVLKELDKEVAEAERDFKDFKDAVDPKKRKENLEKANRLLKESEKLHKQFDEAIKANQDLLNRLKREGLPALQIAPRPSSTPSPRSPGGGTRLAGEGPAIPGDIIEGILRSFGGLKDPSGRLPIQGPDSFALPSLGPPMVRAEGTKGQPVDNTIYPKAPTHQSDGEPMITAAGRAGEPLPYPGPLPDSGRKTQSLSVPNAMAEDPKDRSDRLGKILESILEQLVRGNDETREAGSRGTYREPLVIALPRGSEMAFLSRSQLLAQRRPGVSRAANFGGNARVL